MSTENCTTQRYLVLNKVITPDGTELISRTRHDYRTYEDKNGEQYMVDGGTAYLRRSVNTVPATEASLYSDSSFEDIISTCTWGTYGKDGQQPFTEVVLKDLSTAHIQNILRISTLLPGYRVVLTKLLKQRAE